MKPSEDIQAFVDYYLEKLRQGDFETAFYALIEAGHSAIPLLISAFRLESKSRIRAELVSIIWNYRRPETIPFLREALNDSDPNVWKNALDGLVTMASPTVLEVLQHALTRQFPSEAENAYFRMWVREATELTRHEIGNEHC